MRRKKNSTEAPSAPGDLPFVLDFLNTWDATRDEDSWAGRLELGRWLAERGLINDPEKVDAETWQRAVDARLGLRALLLANSGAELDTKAAGELDRLAVDATCRVRFGDGGAARLEAGSTGLDGALGRVFAGIALAQAQGKWPRVKICASPSCRRAYYDTSKRRPSSCCSAKCRNNRNARRYRQRYEARRGRKPRGGGHP